MSDFTPGPWKTVKPQHGHETEYLCVQIGADEMYTTLELKPADARVIAGVPDLIELARKVALFCNDPGLSREAYELYAKLVGHVPELKP